LNIYFIATLINTIEIQVHKQKKDMIQTV